MSIFSKIGSFVKKRVKAFLPELASAIPFVGQFIAPIVAAKIQGSGGGARARAPPRPRPGVGFVGPPSSGRDPRGLTRRAAPAVRGGFVSGTSRQAQAGFGRAGGTQNMSIFASLGPLVAAGAARALPAIGRAAARGGLGRAIVGGALGAGAVEVIFNEQGQAVCPSGFHLRKDPDLPPACVRNRRMNFGNARAARRSVRRIKGARKLLKDIEKLMPKRTVRAARHSVTHT